MAQVDPQKEGAEVARPILRIPSGALVALIGPAASGKSTWAQKHFEPTQIVSSDTCRALIADDEADQEASRDAFRLFHRIISERLKRGLLTVADSAALTPLARGDLFLDAAVYGRPVVAVVFAVNAETQQAWNTQRKRRLSPSVLTDQRQMLQQALNAICDEGFSQITILRSPEDIDRLIVRIGAFSPEQDEGPFDIIGDVHGCYDELCSLLGKLGYRNEAGRWSHPARRRTVFVGDLADRGPANVAVLRLVMSMVETGTALTISGNHDNKLMRWLMGRPVRIGRWLQATVAEIEAMPEPTQSTFRDRLLNLLRSAPGYLLLDQGKLVVTHAGIRDEMIGHWDRQIASFCLYGDVVGTAYDGMPIRHDWAAERAELPERPLIVYGHVVVNDPAFVNETVDIDTGCCFGGRLTALRYPEREFASVAARRAYAEPRA